LRRQELTEEYFYIEGSVYASRVSSLRARKSFYHERTSPWIVDRYKAIEIDELSDFVAAQALLNAKLEGVPI
jgi:N-acylneuraminate cytidylyltransferase/CMP-N,N'-diacetyllegionaminic acid synthase